MVEQRTARPGELNYALFDPYSLAHGLVGVIASLILGLGMWATLAIAIGWEIAEHLLKNLAPAAFPHPTQDTWMNAAGDVISTMVGWAASQAVRRFQGGRRTS